MLPRLVSSILVASLLGACATVPPAKPMRDVKAITGTWTGQLNIYRGPRAGTYEGKLVINEDGSYVGDHSGFGASKGTIRVVDGKGNLTSETTGNTATVTLHEKEGQEVLVIAGDTGVTRSEYRRARAAGR
jgi:hypothetical protein